MPENYVSRKGLDEKVSRTGGFSHYVGRTIYGLAGLVRSATVVVAAVGGIVYGTMAFEYGQYNAGTVLYAELSGNESLKHRHFEEAKWLYAQRLDKTELDKKDLQNLYLELGVVVSEEKELTEKDISWKRLLDWIEANKVILEAPSK